MKIRIVSLALLVGFLSITSPLWFRSSSLAQESQRGAIFRSDAALLELEVKVAGKGKKPVQGLQREDFTVFEDGVAQEIAAFEYVPAVPLRTAETVQPTQPDVDVTESASRAPVEPRTWIYLATHTGPEERNRIREAIREFIEEQLRPGIAISLNGKPFVTDKTLLLAMLDGQTTEPDGPSAPLDDVQSGTTYSEQFDAVGDGTMASGQELVDPSLVDIAGERRTQTTRAALYRYIDLIRQMGALRGKKAVVLFSRGLRISPGQDADLVDLYRRLSAEATRHRVSYYTVDARGLQTAIWGGDSTYSALANAEVGGPPAPSLRDLQVSQFGIMSVAELTGGRAVINTNDLGEVFDKVEEDLGDYYVLAYYPKDKTAEGRERKIRIEVDRQNLKLSYRKSYYEDLGFPQMSKRQRQRNLEQLVLSDTSFTDLFLETAFHFYRGDDGKPVLAYNTAILPSATWALPDDGSHKLHYTFVASVREVNGNRKPMYDGLVFERTFTADEWRRLRTDPTSHLQFPSSMKLTAGEYIWKAIVRDERTGDVGTYRSRIVVPEFVEESSPSSLLLTRQVVEPGSTEDRKAAEVEQAGVIPFGEMGFLLNPENVYPVGASLFFLYDLYNVASSFAIDPPAPRVFLITEGEPLESPPFEGFEAQALPGRPDVRYAGSLNTKSLSPGDYTLIFRLPDSETGISREFRLQSPDGSQTPMGQTGAPPDWIRVAPTVGSDPAFTED